MPPGPTAASREDWLRRPNQRGCWRVLACGFRFAEWPTAHEIARYVTERTASTQDQRASQFGTQYFECMCNARFTANCQSPEHRSSDRNRPRPEGNRFHYVGAAPNASVEH